MKYIYFKEIKANLGQISEGRKVPVFENREEFIKYKFYGEKLDEEEIAQNMFDASKENIAEMRNGNTLFAPKVKDLLLWEHGEDAAMHEFKLKAHKFIHEEKTRRREDMIKHASRHLGKYYAIKKTVAIGQFDLGRYNDTIELNKGLFVSKEVARECALVMIEKHPNARLKIVDRYGKSMHMKRDDKVDAKIEEENNL